MSRRSTCRSTASSCRTASSSHPSASGANRTPASRRCCPVIARCANSSCSCMARTERTIAGVPVGPLGLGCMNLSHAYATPRPQPQAAALLRRAIDLGVTHFDTAALYGFGSNETLLGEVLAPYRRHIFLASKCGMTGIDGRRFLDGRPETLRRTCMESLVRLRTERIDLYYLHRWD